MGLAFAFWFELTNNVTNRTFIFIELDRTTGINQTRVIHASNIQWRQRMCVASRRLDTQYLKKRLQLIDNKRINKKNEIHLKNLIYRCLLVMAWQHQVNQIFTLNIAEKKDDNCAIGSNFLLFILKMKWFLLRLPLKWTQNAIK